MKIITYIDYSSKDEKIKAVQMHRRFAKNLKKKYTGKDLKRYVAQEVAQKNAWENRIYKTPREKEYCIDAMSQFLNYTF